MHIYFPLVLSYSSEFFYLKIYNILQTLCIDKNSLILQFLKLILFFKII